MLAISALNVYPLKGGRGIAVDHVELDRFGPRFDRRWMVVDTDGNLITQREIPHLCQIVATPEAHAVTLEAPGHGSVVFPIPDPTAPRREVRVWDDRLVASSAPGPVNTWITGFLGVPCEVVHCPDDAQRRTDPDYDPVGSPVSFADGFPLLVAGEASLEALNSRLAEPLPMNRFRPNLVVRGSRPFEEDDWRRFTIAGILFDVVKPCARCQVTTTDQLTASRAVEPLRTMATFRKRGSAVMFGMNVVHRGQGTIRVGDPLEVVTRTI